MGGGDMNGGGAPQHRNMPSGGGNMGSQQMNNGGMGGQVINNNMRSGQGVGGMNPQQMNGSAGGPL